MCVLPTPLGPSRIAERPLEEVIDWCAQACVWCGAAADWRPWAGDRRSLTVSWRREPDGSWKRCPRRKCGSAGLRPQCPRPAQTSSADCTGGSLRPFVGSPRVGFGHAARRTAIRMPADTGTAVRAADNEPAPGHMGRRLFPCRETRGDRGVLHDLHLVPGELREGEAETYVGFAVERAVLPAGC